MVDTTPIREIYDIMEEKMNLSIWAGEKELPPIRVSRECAIIGSAPPNIQSYVFSHCLFGDPSTINILPMFFLQASGNVIDNTHPFDVIQTMLHLMVCGSITLEIKGERSQYRDSCIIYPWGSTHLRQILHFPVKRLDVRGKEACGALLAHGYFTQTSIDTGTNSITNHSFMYNEYIQRIYDHWKPLNITLFLWRILDDVEYISSIRDVKPELTQLIHLMCKHGLPSPESTSNGFFTYRVPTSDGEDSTSLEEIHLPETLPPDVSRIAGNYDVVLPRVQRSVRSGRETIPKNKTGDISIKRMYGDDALLLSDCWDMATTHTFKDIFEGLFTLLSGRIYTRAFTYRLGPPPLEYKEEAENIEQERQKAEERKKDFSGDYPGEILYHY